MKRFASLSSIICVKAGVNTELSGWMYFHVPVSDLILFAIGLAWEEIFDMQ